MIVPRTILALLGLSPETTQIHDLQALPPPSLHDRQSTAPCTQYKMITQSGVQGKKFFCPPNTEMKSCRCPMVLKNGTRIGQLVEVGHTTYRRVCNCKSFLCGSDCKKIVMRAVCCGDRAACPTAELQRPRHKRDWTCRIDIRQTFGIKVTPQQIQNTTDIAINFLNQDPKHRKLKVELYFRKGTYKLDTQGEHLFTIENLKLRRHGELIIAGAGMSLTTIEMVGWLNDTSIIYAYNASQITIRDLHLTRDRPGATQGFVHQALPDSIVLRIPPGFPSPDKIFNREQANGYSNGTYRSFLRRYTNQSSPQIDFTPKGNTQVHWHDIYKINVASQEGEGELWKFILTKPRTIPHSYQPGDLIAVKSKCCGTRNPNSYKFQMCRQILFERVRWTRQSRGVFRMNTQTVSIIDCEIRRDPPINGLGWCLSSSGGGPQFGQPNDVPMNWVNVTNFYAENTGDDSLAFFNVADKRGSSVTNITIRDSFSRSILLNKSPRIQFADLDIERSPVCINDNENEIREIYGNYDYNRRRRSARSTRSARSARSARQPATVRDPDGLRGSKCYREFPDHVYPPPPPPVGSTNHSPTQL